MQTPKDLIKNDKAKIGVHLTLSHLVEGQELDVNNYLPNIGLKQVN